MVSLFQFLTLVLYAFLFFSLCAKFPAHPLLHSLISLIKSGEEYKILKLPIVQFYSVSCYLPLGPDIFVSTLFSNVFSLCTPSV